MVLGQGDTGLDSVATLRLNVAPDLATASLVKALEEVPMVKENNAGALQGMELVQVRDTSSEVAGLGCGAGEETLVTRCSSAWWEGYHRSLVTCHL